jgi:hypothetical protein
LRFGATDQGAPQVFCARIRAKAVSNYLRQSGYVQPGRILSPSAMGEGTVAPARLRLLVTNKPGALSFVSSLRKRSSNSNSVGHEASSRLDALDWPTFLRVSHQRERSVGGVVRK